MGLETSLDLLILTMNKSITETNIYGIILTFLCKTALTNLSNGEKRKGK